MLCVISRIQSTNLVHSLVPFAALMKEPPLCVSECCPPWESVEPPRDYNMLYVCVCGVDILYNHARSQFTVYVADECMCARSSLQFLVCGLGERERPH